MTLKFLGLRKIFCIDYPINEYVRYGQFRTKHFMPGKPSRSDWIMKLLLQMRQVSCWRRDSEVFPIDIICGTL